eukprot:8077956-Pyramimonas_sp.AAC.1
MLSPTRRGPSHPVASAGQCYGKASHHHCALHVRHPTGGGETARQNVEPPAPAALRGGSLEERLGVKWPPPPN